MKLVIDLKEYVSPRCETSYYKGIPMEYLDIVKKILKKYNCNYKIRYRGPRKNDGRDSWFNQQSNCLKSNAVTFTVYKGIQ
jgi:hypothetical protein